MKCNSATYLILFITLCFVFCVPTVHAFEKEIHADTRCTVCGMFVSKYPAWISKIVHKDGKKEYFDGVKDMLVYYFNPEKYGAVKGNPIVELLVQDYYSLTSFDAKKAYYVVGSDVYGPMGHEFIPFSSSEAAEAFNHDHHGREILTFDRITSELVESMRSGTRMK